MKHRIDFVIGFCLLMLAVTLIAPLFQIEYLDNWGSIDSTFIADARFLIEHWPHPLWQPLWYCGTRFDYIYPPALRYGTAITAIALHVSTARAYHVYTAVLYCLGILAVYAFSRTAGGSRLMAAMAAVASACLSPSFLLLPSFRDDAFLHMPQRLNVLIKWGEGPHVSSLSLLPFALLFTWKALRSQSRLPLVLAACCCALVVAHNFYGATALAILFPLIIWSVSLTSLQPKALVKAVSIALLAYGLSAFWLTPSYLRVTMENLKLVAQPGNAWSGWLGLLALALYAAVSWRWARGRETRGYAVFLAGAVLCFGLIVIGHYYAGFRIIGEPHRFVPELDFVLILAASEGLRRFANLDAPFVRYAAYAAILAALGTACPYLARPWSVFKDDTNFADRVEYKLASWISANLPGARVFSTSTLRFWYNVWHDGAQVGGGSEQGLLNPMIALAQWQILQDENPGRDLLWLKALGADAIVVPEPQSPQIFHDYKQPYKFRGFLPVLHDDGHGNVIYSIPRKFANRARVVNTGEFDRLRPIPYSNEVTEELTAYVRALEERSDKMVRMNWEGNESMRLQVALSAGESLVVQESFDPAWRAYAGSDRIEISKDPIGFMRLRLPPGDNNIRLVYEEPQENQGGRWMVALTFLIMLSAVSFEIYQRRSLSLVARS